VGKASFNRNQQYEGSVIFGFVGKAKWRMSNKQLQKFASGITYVESSPKIPKCVVHSVRTCHQNSITVHDQIT